MIIQKDIKLSEVMWYQIGGVAQYLLSCTTPEDITKALDFIQKNHIKKFIVVGTGSNLLFSDEYYEGAVIKVGSSEEFAIHESEKGVVESFAGESLDSVITYSLDKNLLGLEWAGGLPGTVGAAIRGNVGAFGGEIKDSFHSAHVLKIEYKKGTQEINKFSMVIMNRRDIKFGYRSSTVKSQKNMVVVSASFKLKKGTEEQVRSARQTYYGNIEYRKNRHPMDLPSNGSAFKNIHDAEEIKSILEVYPDIEQKVKVDWHGKASVGYLIKRLDLSGFRIGNAQISHKHSNFIVNLGGASFTDVLGVIKKVQDTFQENFGFSPEPEVEIVE